MSRESQAEKALALFNQKSNQAQVLFKQEVLNQKFGLKKPDDAIQQYLLKWNDTVRQGILSIAYEAVGGHIENVVSLQVAFSFIDATMDIHDDIIDDSLRKKKTKTMYGKLGAGTALLIGDLFLVRGFCQLHQAIQNLPTEKQFQIMDTVNNFLTEVVKAHMAEAKLRPIKWNVKPENYLNILKHKAAEIEGRMKVAAIYGGGTEEEIKALSTYGRNLGILLAVRAEYTDLFEPRELSNRVKCECLPLHILYALKKKKYREKIKLLLSQPTLPKKATLALLQMMNESGALVDLNNELKSLQREAENSLKIINHNEKKYLKLIITSMLEDM